MKLFVTRSMQDPRESGYEEAVGHWIEHFIEQSSGRAFVLFTKSVLNKTVAA